MRKSTLLLLSLFFTFHISVEAQSGKGKLVGKIVDKSTASVGELIGAIIIVEGTSYGTTTDVEGNYNLELPVGNYTVLIKYTGYKTEQAPITIQSNEITHLDMAIGEEKVDLNEVVITSKIEKSSSLSLIQAKRNAAVISDGISSDIIRKTPDRNVSDVLKRVTGASIQEGKFAIIRGMNDRYNAGYLDNTLLPSTEADRKAFSFDVVPASLIDNVQIIKAGSPELSGDFGGGIIRINTKAVPEAYTQSISIGAHYTSTGTFKNFKEFSSYPGEQFNILNSKRSLPNLEEGQLKTTTSFPSLLEKQRLGETSKLFNHDWENKEINSPLNPRFSYVLGFPIALKNNNKLGFLLALNYSDTRKVQSGEISSYDGSGQVSDFNDQLYQRNTSEGAIFNINFVGAKSQLSFRNLFNSNLDRNTIVRIGKANITDGIDVNNVANFVNFNRLTNSILSFKQIFGTSVTALNLNASVNYSNICRKTPDYRIASYTKSQDDSQFNLSTGDFFNSSTGRYYSELLEDVVGSSLELSKGFNDRFKSNVKIGGFYQYRNRDFNGRSFVYGGVLNDEITLNPAIDLAGKHIGADQLYLVEKTSDDIAYYHGQSNVSAAFLSVDQRWMSKLRSSYGLRYEMVDIQVDNQKFNTEIAQILKSSLLPSINLTYNLNERVNLRAAYFASVNRPEFRELAPFAFYVFDKNADIKGNKNLKIATLHNIDLRWEFYPSGVQLISLGVFQKYIQNPVEFSIDIAQPFTTFTYQNEKSAKISGLEFEMRKNLSFLGRHKVFNQFALLCNLTLVKSSLQFNEGSKALTNRSLQGQSPYIVNVGLQYESEDKKWSANVMMNRTGRRIAYVGVDPKYGQTRQDIFEAPRSVLDLQVSRSFKKFNLKITCSDLFHEQQLYYQDTNNNKHFDEVGGDRTLFKYNTAWQSTLSLSYNF